jgi:hypothetical protein
MRLKFRGAQTRDGMIATRLHDVQIGCVLLLQYSHSHGTDSLPPHTSQDTNLDTPYHKWHFLQHDSKFILLLLFQKKLDLGNLSVDDFEELTEGHRCTL